jgi:hypothetical protein
VYLSKDEAMQMTADSIIDAPAVEVRNENDKSKVAPVQEGDVLLFQVKLSTEGFPQAVQAKKIRCLRGTVRQSPVQGCDGTIVVNGEDAEQGNDEALKDLLGVHVRLQGPECGQLQLVAGDEVRFCCVNGVNADGRSCLEAQLVELISTSRVAGSMLGCFSLHLPQLPSSKPSEDADDNSTAASYNDIRTVELHGYAITDRICLSEVPLHVSVADVKRLFSKLGGNEPIVSPVHGDCTVMNICIGFSAPEFVAKFLTHATHTISENGMTHLAHVGPMDPCLQQKLESGQYLCASIDRREPQVSCESQPCASLQPCSTPVVLEASIPPPDSNAVCAQPSQVCCPILQSQMALLVGTAPSPDWRCAHGSIVVSPGAPEMQVSRDSLCGMCVQWPTVIHASAYVVELFNQGTMLAQRFMRAAPEGAPPALVDLRIDGLQPGPYAACVRSIAPCGCESTPSPWSFLQVGAMTVMPSGGAGLLLPPAPASVAPAAAQCSILHTCPPPPSMPPALPLSTAVPVCMELPSIPEELNDTPGCGNEILTLD